MRDGRTPIVSVNIPCFRQLPLARRTVDAFLGQTFEDFELTLFDDDGSDEYREYVASLGDPRVRYSPNPERFGAMRNMFACIAAGCGKYSVAFHEDDVPDRRFLAAAVSILESRPDCGFVACELRELRDGRTEDSPAEDDLEYEYCADRPAFLRTIFNGIEPMFGSVVYRRAAVAGHSAEHQWFGPVADRPFLLSILAEWSCAIIRRPALAFYRVHGDGDDRHRGLHSDHVLHLFQRYRAAFPKRLSRDDQLLFSHYSGYWLLTLYNLTPTSQRRPLLKFLTRALREGLYDWRFAGRYGRKRLLSELLFQRAGFAS